MSDNFSKVYVSVEDLAVRIMHVDPDRPLFMFDERILIFSKSDSFYLPSVKTPKMAANPLKKTEIRRYTTEVPAFRPFSQRYGWTLWVRGMKCEADFVNSLNKVCIKARTRITHFEHHINTNISQDSKREVCACVRERMRAHVIYHINGC